MEIRFIDLQRQYQEYKHSLDSHIQEVLDSASYIMGDKVYELERTLADFVGVKHAIAVSSGTSALQLALMVRGVSRGDEIITPAFTFFATAEVISLQGATPVFVDIDEATYNIDPTKIEASITDNTKGIIVVDLFGQCADYERISKIAMKYNLFIIQDAAQSFGAEYKGRKACSQAEMACTSFFPAKPLGCYGDGGMLFTNDERSAAIVRSLRVHGKGSQKYDNVRIGLNARLDTLQAAVLLAKFPKFAEEIKKRQKIADYYTEKLKDFVITPTIYEGNLSVYAQYCIRIKNRDRLRLALKEKGVPTAVYYPTPLHLQAAFSHLNYRQGDLPISEKVSREIMAIPMHPFLEINVQDYIIQHIKSFAVM